jgi:uncharacterized protein YndB with AHSA1/START domain
MSKRPAHYASFIIERNYAASPAQVFAALAEPKAHWSSSRRGRARATPWITSTQT